MPFRILDGVLIRAPSWYRTPLAQTIALGTVFFCVFTAYTTIQFYAASIYGPTLAADSVGAVYLSFTLSCLAAPAVTNRLGCRWTMFLGILGYATLVLCSLVYFLLGSSGDEGGDGDSGGWGFLVVAGGAILGCGAALLWTAQGRLILQYGAVAEEIDDREKESSGNVAPGGGNALEEGNGSRTGILMGVFWAVFQCSALVGGTISFLYYDKKPSGSVLLYVIFLAFILVGALSTQFLLPPSMLRDGRLDNASTCKKNVTTKNYENISSQNDSETAAPLTEPTKAAFQIETTKLVHRDSMYEDVSDDPMLEEAAKTLGLFFTKPMILLSILFFYTGFNQPYQQGTFGNRFFTKRTIGAELITFHIMEIIGAIYCGRALDSNEVIQMHPVEKAESYMSNKDTALPTSKARRGSAVRCLILFVLVNTTGNILALLQEHKCSDRTPDAIDISDVRALWPSLAFALWGFADSQIQVYCYWLIGLLYSCGNDHSRAVGFYKCVQSLGFSVGFYLIPTSRMSALAQLCISFGVFVVGTCLSLFQLPA